MVNEFYLGENKNRNKTGGIKMSRRHGIMSDALKYELAKELGVYDIVKREGWGSVPSRDCGNLVAAAIRYASKLMEEKR